MNNEVQMVPLTALESQAQRDHQTMRYLALGWCITLALAIFTILCMASYEEETVETVETTVEQAADNSGANYFANGDLTSGSNAESNGQED